MLVVELFAVSLISYLIGSVNLSIILSKLMGKGDIREQGSKNAGTTNTLRVLGKGPALMVFVWDVLKGVIGVMLARWIANMCGFEGATYAKAYSYGMMLATLFAVMGHNFPIYFGFKGGKGVATSLGAILAIEPQIGLVCLCTGILVIAVFNMVSMGSIIAAFIYPIMVFFMGTHFDTRIPSYGTIRGVYVLFSVVMAASVIFRHKANIQRIKTGKENQLIKPKNDSFNDENASTDDHVTEIVDEVVEEVKEEVKEVKEELKEEVKEDSNPVEDKKNTAKKSK